MKKLLKILGLILLAVLLIIVCAAIYINASGVPTYETEKIDYTARADSAGLVRGEKLVATLCAGCHINKETGQLTGSPLYDAPPEFGEIYAPNITQDKTYGIGEWTDGEILYLLRTGIKRDGQYAPAYMAKLPHMSDYDINAIIAFLNSDHKMVNPAAVEDKPCEPAFLTKFLCKVAWKPYPMPENPIPRPDTSNLLELGKYLTFNLECYQCHSESFETNNTLEPEKSKGYLGGGNTLLTMNGDPISVPNITPDNETGIGNWTDEQFLKAVKYGAIEGEVPLQYPMQPYNKFTDKEILAIHAYIKTIPPVTNQVERITYD